MSGNGALSSNDVQVSNTNTTTVSQTNDANIQNNVSTNASTGGNDASFNTGGDVDIDTGDASANVDIRNQANSNIANLDSCSSCQTGNTSVNVSGNGAGSDTDVSVDKSNSTGVFQDNYANFDNNVRTNASTGNNDANYNTGGDVRIDTGDARADVDISNSANKNIATFGGGSGGGGNTEVRVSGNGAFSDNTVDILSDNSTLLSQRNDARIDNDVHNNLRTGYNDASGNTGGDVRIDTGSARANVDINNLANFNAADFDTCGCVSGGLNAKISGNGYNSDNVIRAAFDNRSDVYQDNDFDQYNDVHNYLKSGYNDVSYSTGRVGGSSDPNIDTGNTRANVDISNVGNKNILGSHGGGLGNIQFEWDTSMLHALGFWM